jgi:hypothetical protein
MSQGHALAYGAIDKDSDAIDKDSDAIDGPLAGLLDSFETIQPRENVLRTKEPIPPISQVEYL